MKKNVAVIVGSLRAGATTGKVARALIANAPETLALSVVPIGDLPLYNQDLETGTPPAPWARFRDSLADADAILFVTPEFNRSVPAALKNAIEVASRPYGKSVLDHLPGAVVSASPGLLGGALAAMHLRQILTNSAVKTMQQPEVYLSGADKLFDENDVIVNDGTRKFLGSFMQSFDAWITANG